MRGGEKGRSESLDEPGALAHRVAHLEAVAGQEETAAISTLEDEKWLRILSRVSPIGIFRTDLRGHCLYVNARWSEITGLTAEEAYGQGWGRTLHPEDQERIFSAWNRAAQNRTAFREEYRFQRASGEITWVLGQAEAERGEDGAVVGYVGTITDITAQKNAEETLQKTYQVIEQQIQERTRALIESNEALRQSEGRYQSLTAACPTGIFQNDPDGKCTYVNQRWLEIAGRTKEDSLGDDWTHSIVPEEREAVLTEWKACAREGREFSREFQLVRPDGSVRWVHSRTAPVYAEDGTLFGHVGTTEDITERKRASEAVRVSEERFTLAVRGADEGIWDWDTVSNKVYYAPRYRELLGYQEHEFPDLLATWESALHPDDHDGVMKALRNHLERKVPFDLEYRLRTKSDDYRWFSARGQVIWGADGKPTRMAGSIRDITLHRQLQELLEERTERLNVTLTSIGDGVITTDTQGCVTFLNPVAEHITGWTKQEALGRPISEVATLVHEHTRQAVENPVSRVLKEGRVIGLANHTLLLTRDGREVPVADSGAPIRGKYGKLYGVVMVFRDVTEERQVERETFRAKELAEEANRVKGEFLATMSHELRTPLNVIMGYVDLMIEDAFGPLSAEQKQTLQRVRVSADELFLLISALLDLSRLEEGRLPIEKQEIDLATFIEQLRVETEGLQDLSHLEFVWQVDPGCLSISTDANKLKTIVKNLIGNAIKFTESGQITLTACSLPEGIEIAVTDTGIGIPVEAQRLIFEPFRQIDGSTTRQYNGSGLGLHIVKRLLEALGGTISVESAAGKGSTFCVWLPYEQAQPTSEV